MFVCDTVFGPALETYTFRGRIVLVRVIDRLHLDTVDSRLASRAGLSRIYGGLNGFGALRLIFDGRNHTEMQAMVYKF
jgi:hypothetical protein